MGVEFHLLLLSDAGVITINSTAASRCRQARLNCMVASDPRISRVLRLIADLKDIAGKLY